MLAKDISRVVFARQMINRDHVGSNSLTDMVKGEGIVMLVKFGMWNGGTVDNGLIVTKHVTLGTNWNAKVMESKAKINDLVNAGARSNKLRSISGSFDSGLLLRVPINWSLVE